MFDALEPANNNGKSKNAKKNAKKKSFGGGQGESKSGGDDGLDSLDANLVEAPRLLELPLEFARSTNFKVETCEDDAPVDGGAAFDRRGVSTTARPARGESPPPALSPARVYRRCRGSRVRPSKSDARPVRPPDSALLLPRSTAPTSTRRRSPSARSSRRSRPS